MLVRLSATKFMYALLEKALHNSIGIATITTKAIMLTADQAAIFFAGSARKWAHVLLALDGAFLDLLSFV